MNMAKFRNIRERLIATMMAPVVTYGLDPDPAGNAVLHSFFRRCLSMEQPRVLELGTSRSEPGRSTRHEHWVRHAGEYLGTDIVAGIDVDIVADVHRLTQVTGHEQFDVIISCSAFEHFKYPHLAAHEVLKALRVGGLLFVQTHQAYPLHAHPYDYFRFSTEALAGLFGSQMGFRVLNTGYEFPAKVYAGKGYEGKRMTTQHVPAFLNVSLYGEKIGKTPGDYIYEFDALK